MDELLTDIAESGWLFNNCYQVDSALWRVSLRRPGEGGDWFSDWAEGPTFADALVVCMSKLADAEWEYEREVTVAAKGLVPEVGSTGTDLLSRLGLNRPKPKIERRI